MRVCSSQKSPLWNSISPTSMGGSLWCLTGWKPCTLTTERESETGLSSTSDHADTLTGCEGVDVVLLWISTCHFKHSSRHCRALESSDGVWMWLRLRPCFSAYTVRAANPGMMNTFNENMKYIIVNCVSESDEGPTHTVGCFIFLLFNCLCLLNIHWVFHDCNSGQRCAV